jgi:hypothetical protein
MRKNNLAPPSGFLVDFDPAATLLDPEANEITHELKLTHERASPEESSSRRELTQERAHPGESSPSPTREFALAKERVRPHPGESSPRRKLIQERELTQESAHPRELSPRRELTKE